MILTGLPDTRTIRKAELFRSATKALQILRKGLVATSASDNGAINIWKDKYNQWRCERQRYCVTRAEGSFKTIKDVLQWLKKELPKIQ